MKQLQLGFMSSQEIADWFGLTYGSFKNKRQNRLQALREYCAYTPVRGGITITKIFYDTYDGDLSKKDVQTAVKYVNQQQKLQNVERPLLSGSMMAQDLVRAGDPEYLKITEASGQNKARRSLSKAYGTPGFANKEDYPPIPGPYGRRYWIWATKDYLHNRYVPFTEEDWEAFSEAFYPTEQNKQRYIQSAETLIFYALEAGELTPEEFTKEIKDAKSFNFKLSAKIFKNLTGKILVRCQEFELNTSFAEE